MRTSELGSEVGNDQLLFDEEGYMTYGMRTHYKGKVYASRTEARWAVLFDSLGIPYVSEPEKFYFYRYPGLGRVHGYTPDFELIKRPSARSAPGYVEIKGQNLYDDPAAPLAIEELKCCALSAKAHKPVALISGSIDPVEHYANLYYEGRRVIVGGTLQFLSYPDGYFIAVVPANKAEPPSLLLQAAFANAITETFKRLDAYRNHDLEGTRAMVAEYEAEHALQPEDDVPNGRIRIGNCPMDIPVIGSKGLLMK